MGILRKALKGFGDGLQQKALLDWDKIKADSEMEARKALAELEMENRNANTDRQITAADERSERELKYQNALAGGRMAHDVAMERQRGANQKEAIELRARAQLGLEDQKIKAGAYTKGADYGYTEQSSNEYEYRLVPDGNGGFTKVIATDQNDKPIIKSKIKTRRPNMPGAPADDGGLDLSDDEAKAFQSALGGDTAPKVDPAKIQNQMAAIDEQLRQYTAALESNQVANHPASAQGLLKQMQALGNQKQALMSQIGG